MLLEPLSYKAVARRIIRLGIWLGAHCSFYSEAQLPYAYDALYSFRSILGTLIFVQCPCNSLLYYVTLNTVLVNNNS